MIEERIAINRIEKAREIEELKKNGYMSSHKISKMLESGLVYFGNRKQLFQEMRELAESHRTLKVVKLICGDCKNVTYWYLSWDIAKILMRLEKKDRNRSLKFCDCYEESESEAYP